MSLIIGIRDNVIKVLVELGADRDSARAIADKICNEIKKQYGGAPQWVPVLRRQYDVSSIVADRKRGESLRKIAKKHNVSHETVRNLSADHLANDNDWLL